MELIDKKELVELLKKSPVWTGLDAITRINTMDSIDIVRCKECVHFEPYSVSCNISNGLRNATADDFCSYGVKKGADDE